MAGRGAHRQFTLLEQDTCLELQCGFCLGEWDSSPGRVSGVCIGLALSLGSLVETFFAGKGYSHVVVTFYNRLLSVEQVGEHNRVMQRPLERCQIPWLAAWPKLAFLLCFLFVWRMESSASTGEC